MELGSLEVQIFVSLVVVLGTAFIALVCDFLKGNNEQLRERNVELRARQDERERLGLSQPLAWLQGLAALVQRAPSPPAAPVEPTRMSTAPAPATTAAPDSSLKVDNPTVPVTTAPPAPAEEPPIRRRLYDQVRPATSNTQWASKEELEQLAGRAARIRARQEAGQQSPETGSAIGSPAPKPEVETGGATASKPVAPEPTPPPSSPVATETPKIRVLPVPFLVEQNQPSVETVPPPAAAADVESIQTALLETEPEPHPPSSSDRLPEGELKCEPEGTTARCEPALDGWMELTVGQAAVPSPDVPVPTPPVESAPCAAQFLPETAEPVAAVEPTPITIPSGLHDSATLSALLEANRPFSGVVVSIGINDFEALRERLSSGEQNTESLAPLNKLITSMLRPGDFASRFQEDDFILLFPGEAGSAAQRRLFQVSEKLWDFQLRSLGQLAVMFSWGGLEVTNEPLSNAVAAARERMFQTRRNRRQAGDRKRVANG